MISKRNFSPCRRMEQERPLPDDVRKVAKLSRMGLPDLAKPEHRHLHRSETFLADGKITADS